MLTKQGNELSNLSHFDSYEGLSPYGEPSKQIESRNDAIATLSAGYRDPNTKLPVASRDGKIHLHDPQGRAPYLKQVLEANRGKTLTITPCSDNPNEFFQENFAKRSKTRLEAWGDKSGITEIKILKTQKKGDFENIVESERIFHPAGTSGFEALRAECKVEISFFFYLARWNPDGSTTMIFNDGLAPYRLRTTSQETRSGFMQQMRMVAGFSHGRVRGVPFDLVLINKDKVDPHGTRREKVPIFKILMKPPGGLELDPISFNRVLTSGIEQSNHLYLPAPQVMTLEDAVHEIEVDVIDPLDTDSAHLLESGINKDFRLKQWFQHVRGTHLEPEEAQIAHLEAYSAYSSRSDAAKYLTDDEWNKLLESVVVTVANHHKAQTEAKAEADLNDSDKYRPEITQEHISSLNKLVTSCDIPKTQALDFISWLAGEMLLHKRDISPETVFKAEARVTEFKDVGLAVCDAYRDWCQSDDSAKDVLE